MTVIATTAETNNHAVCPIVGSVFGVASGFVGGDGAGGGEVEFDCSVV